MKEALAAPRTEMSPYAPRMVRIMIPSDKIGMLIGPGGKTIRELEARTGCIIEINDDDSGEVLLASKDKAALDACKALIEGMTQELNIGMIYPAKVVSLKVSARSADHGPGGDGLVHIRNHGPARHPGVGLLKVGLEVEIKMVAADPGRAASRSGSAPGEGLPPLRLDGSAAARGAPVPIELPRAAPEASSASRLPSAPSRWSRRPAPAGPGPGPPGPGARPPALRGGTTKRARMKLESRGRPPSLGRRPATARTPARRRDRVEVRRSGVRGPRSLVGAWIGIPARDDPQQARRILRAPGWLAKVTYLPEPGPGIG
jgi:hypothetical protein